MSSSLEPGHRQFVRRARAWRNVATSASMRRVRPQWVPPPHAAHLILTFRCNLKCQSCPSWKQKNHDDLSAAEWLDVFRQLKSLDVVKILGGEPMIRKDIVEILSAARDIVDPYMLQMTTNGMLTQRIVDAIHAVAWPGLQLRISIDGTEATHDKMRGVEGSWAVVNKTAQAVAGLKDRYGFKFGINFAVTDESIHELDAMIEYADSLGADLIPGVNVHPFLVGTIPPEERLQQVIKLEDPAAALSALENKRVGIRRQLPAADHLLTRFITKSTFRKQIEEGKLSFLCRELRDLLYMLPNGDVVRCGMDHGKVGNVREQRFDEIWHGEAIRAHRQKVDKCPGCLQASVQIMSRLYGGCLLA